MILSKNEVACHAATNATDSRSSVQDCSMDKSVLLAFRGYLSLK